MIKNVESEGEETPFAIHAYRKQELAMMYFRYASKECATRNLRRWIEHCTDLREALLAGGYDKNRHFFLSKEVKLIVEYLGEP